ncbi:hypothetical protein B0H17DRAFT_1083318 [Mycena rosella]|uniref:Uncharacterized protein n=1 Tax=Mycena rosella TaxID=1033263 RepID=A0AAD7D0I4_MYCRO|nr:hypothetical protein B0H17DRAFT_1083318 [Mycena rosella]
MYYFILPTPLYRFPVIFHLGLHRFICGPPTELTERSGAAGGIAFSREDIRDIRFCSVLLRRYQDATRLGTA